MARAVFPLLYYPGFSTPTIKHGCPRTMLASCVRSASNKVSPNPIILKQWEDYCKQVLFKEWLKDLASIELEADFETYLQKPSFNETYRNVLRKAIKERDVNKIVSYKDDQENKKIKVMYFNIKYGGFTKDELQYSDFPHEYKDSIVNVLKERMIYTPDAVKKLYNAVCERLEFGADMYIPEYCGRKDWPQICSAIDEKSEKIPNIIYGAADGSGFDQTQLICHNEVLNWFMIEAVEQSNFLMDPIMSIEEFKYALRESLVMQMSVANGNLKYEAVGRASGDGWTTLGNTILMISYWKFCFWKAGIPKDQYFLMVKGDDVLFGFNKKYMDVFEIARNELFTMHKHKHTHGLGQICKKIDFGDITELDFLSNHFFRGADGRLRMTRIPPRVFQSISYSMKFKEDSSPLLGRQLCYSKGASLLAWSDGLPIFDKLARKMMSLGVKGEVSDYSYYSDYGRVWFPNKPDREAYLDYLNQHYKISEREVEMIETKIDSIKPGDLIIEIPELAIFFRSNYGM